MGKKAKKSSTITRRPRPSSGEAILLKLLEQNERLRNKVDSQHRELLGMRAEADRFEQNAKGAVALEKQDAQKEISMLRAEVKKRAERNTELTDISVRLGTERDQAKRDLLGVRKELEVARQMALTCNSDANKLVGERDGLRLQVAAITKHRDDIAGELARLRTLKLDQVRGSQSVPLRLP